MAKSCKEESCRGPEGSEKMEVAIRDQLPQEGCWVVVDHSMPYSIKAASTEWCYMFGFDSKQVDGLPMKAFMGPKTDLVLCRDLSRGCAEGRSGRGVACLYSQAGESLLTHVEASPLFGAGGEPSHCLFKIEICDWVPYKIAILEERRAKVTISSKDPHVIEDATSHFTEIFAKPGVQIVGRTLRTIFGPRTDISAWQDALKGAAFGRRQQLSLWLCLPDMTNVLSNITVFPSVKDATISHFMVVFQGGIMVPEDDVRRRRTSMKSSPLASISNEAGAPEQASSSCRPTRGRYLSEMQRVKSMVREIIFDCISAAVKQSFSFQKEEREVQDLHMEKAEGGTTEDHWYPCANFPSALAETTVLCVDQEGVSKPSKWLGDQRVRDRDVSLGNCDDAGMDCRYR